MTVEQKREVIELLRRAPVAKKRTLAQLGWSASTYYRWQQRFRLQGDVGLLDRRPLPATVWNRLKPQEEQAILSAALREPERSPREQACWLSDHGGFAVSEYSVYCVLKRHGLIRAMQGVGFPAGKEYRPKTTQVNEQWQSDASYFFVIGWGWYYLISVLDDYSRMILAWRLQTDMTADSISEVVQRAVEWTGMTEVPVKDRSRLLTDNGSGYLAHALQDHLSMLSIRHIRCAPHHPQTNGKIERFHETLKSRVNLLVYTSPDEPRRAIGEFIEFYNHRRYHEGIGNVAPADLYYQRRQTILERRAEQKRSTIGDRLRYNRSRWLNNNPGDLRSDLSLTFRSACSQMR
jgi:putative transposase